MKVLMYSNSDFNQCLLTEEEEPAPSYSPLSKEKLNRCVAKNDFDMFCLDVVSVMKEGGENLPAECWEITLLEKYREHHLTIQTESFHSMIFEIRKVIDCTNNDITYMIVGWKSRINQLYLAAYTNRGPLQAYISPAEMCHYCQEPFVKGYGFKLSDDMSVCNECADKAIEAMYSPEVQAVVYSDETKDRPTGTVFVKKDQYIKGANGRITYVSSPNSDYNKNKRDLFRVSKEWAKLQPESE